MKNKFIMWIFSLMALAALLTIVEEFVSSFQCPGIADESWLFYITQHDIPSQFSFFVKYLGFARDWTLESHRLLWTALRIFSGCFLGWAFYVSFRNKCLTKIDVWVMVLMIPSLYGFSQYSPAPSYVTLNYAYGCVAVGCFLLALKWCKSKFSAMTLMVCSGAMIAQCVFIMPPNALIVLLMMITLLILDRRMLVVYIAGGFVGIIIFFAVFCSPTSFLDSVNFFRSLNFVNTDGHNMMVLVRWLYSTAKEYLPIVLFAVAFSYGAKSMNEHRPIYKVVLMLLVVYSLLHTSVLLRSGIFKFSMVRVDLCVLYFVAVVLLTHYAQEKLMNKDFLLMLVLLACPIFLSFGTNVQFDHRATRYMIFLLLPTWLLTRKYSSDLGYSYFGLLSIVYLAFMVWHLGLPNGYSGARLVDSRSSLREFGTRCFATEQIREDLVKLRDMTKDRPLVVGGRDSWRTVALLKKEPVSTLWYKPELIVSILKKEMPSKDKVFLLEQPSFKLSEKDEADIKSLLGANSIRRQIVSPTLTVVFFN